MAILGIGGSFAELSKQVDQAYGRFGAFATAVWLENEERLEPIVEEVIQVVPWISPILAVLEISGLQPESVSQDVLDRVDEALDTFDGVETVRDEVEELESMKQDMDATVIGGPELEAQVQDYAEMAAAQQVERQDLAAALDQGEAAYWSRNSDLGDDAKQQARVQLEEARQREDRERDAPSFS